MGSENDFFANAKNFEEEGHFDLAIEQYEYALESGTGDQAIAHERRGKALVRLGRLEEALDESQEALRLNPDLHLAHGVAGYIYLRQAKYDLAQSELLAALRLQPDDMIALSNLMATYSALGQYQQATVICEEAVRHQPENFECRIRLSQLYLVQHRTWQAIEQLNKVVAVKPSMLEVYPFYALVVKSVVLQHFNQLHFFARLGALAGLYLVALLVPFSASVTIGILLSLFMWLVIATDLWFRNYRGGIVKIQTTFVMIFALSLYCILYWVVVLLHQVYRIASPISGL